MPAGLADREAIVQRRLRFDLVSAAGTHEAMSGSRLHRHWRSRVDRRDGQELNPYFEFEGAVSRMEARLVPSSVEKHYYMKPGSVEQVIKDKATLARGSDFSIVPEGTVDVAVAMLPYGDLKPAPDAELVGLAWLSGKNGSEAPVPSCNVRSYRRYFKDIHKCLKVGGRMNLVVEREFDALRMLLDVEPLLLEIGFERVGKVPGEGPNGVEAMRRNFARQPDALMYGKLG